MTVEQTAENLQMHPEPLCHQHRFDRIQANRRQQEIDAPILQDLVKSSTPPFENWYLRYRARQAVMPFEVEAL